MRKLARGVLSALALTLSTSVAFDARSQDSVTRTRPGPELPEHGVAGLLAEGGGPTAPDGYDQIGVPFGSWDALGLAGVGSEPSGLYPPEPLTFAPGGLALSGVEHGSAAPAMGYFNWITRVRDRQALARWVALPRRVAVLALYLLRRR